MVHKKLSADDIRVALQELKEREVLEARERAQEKLEKKEYEKSEIDKYFSSEDDYAG